jgi:hypothetical protein
MAILNPPDILPEAMRYLVRALLALGRPDADRDELIGLVAPRGLTEAMGDITVDSDDSADAEPDDLKTGGTLIASRSLDGLQSLGIVKPNGSRVALTEAAAQWKKPADVTPRRMRQVLLDAALRTAVPEAPYGEETGSTDLMQAVVLLYQAERPLLPFDRFESGRVPRSGGRAFAEWESACCGSVRPKIWPVPNSQQWLPFRRWAPYLGLARSVGTNGLIPDASDALIERLPELQPGDYDIGDFIRRCAVAVPVLDGGVLWRRVEATTDGDNGVLSGGLSISLLQLEADEYMTMVPPKSDTDRNGRIIRRLPDRSADRMVATITWYGMPRRGGR